MRPVLYQLSYIAMVDPKGFEPLPRESKSRLLPLQHGSICKSNRIRTYTLGFVNQCAIHYTINLLHSFQDCVSTERETRTLKKLLLRQLRMPFRHLCILYLRWDSNPHVLRTTAFKTVLYTSSITQVISTL